MRILVLGLDAACHMTRHCSQLEQIDVAVCIFIYSTSDVKVTLRLYIPVDVDLTGYRRMMVLIRLLEGAIIKLVHRLECLPRSDHDTSNLLFILALTDYSIHSIIGDACRPYPN